MSRNKLSKARAEIGEFLHTFFSDAAANLADDARAHGDHHGVRIWNAVSKGMKSEVQKLRVGEADNYQDELLGLAPSTDYPVSAPWHDEALVGQGGADGGLNQALTKSERLSKSTKIRKPTDPGGYNRSGLEK